MSKQFIAHLNILSYFNIRQKSLKIENYLKTLLKYMLNVFKYRKSNIQ